MNNPQIIEKNSKFHDSNDKISTSKIAVEYFAKIGKKVFHSCNQCCENVS